MESTALIASVSIENLLQTREAMLERFTKMQTLAIEIKQLGVVFEDAYPPRFEWEFNGTKHSLTSYYQEGEEEKIAKDYRQAIDRLGWRFLMEKSGFLAYMDAKAKEEWREGLKKEEMPELTYTNIMATFQGLHANRGELFDRGVINVFRSLSWDKKTNSPFRFEKKIIVSYCSGWYNTGKEKLDDLNRCFHLLDGKPEPEYRHSISHVDRRESLFENEYLTLKLYKNGNGHVEFKRLDLVEQLNETIARHFPFHIPQDNKAAA